MTQDLFIHDETEQSIGAGLLDASRYWENRRIPFNLIVGVAGLFDLIALGEINLFGLFGALVWGLVANALFSLGYVLESILLVRRRGNNPLRQWRPLLYGAGTILYLLVTLSYAVFFVMISALK